MTIDDSDIDNGSFQGLMKSLNIDDIKQYDSNTFADLTFSQLSQVKKEIESQLNLLFDLLKQKYNADMDTPLVIDGYPRSDIDVVTIRMLRVQIIRLRNDDKMIINILNEKMVSEFQQRQELQGGDVNEETKSEMVYNIPFAQVKEVLPNGPAYKSGLKEGDLILLFDKSIHASNHNKLMNLVTRVKSKINQEIEIELKRDNNKLKLYLTPTDNWEGQGLLGCRIVPI